MPFVDGDLLHVLPGGDVAFYCPGCGEPHRAKRSTLYGTWEAPSFSEAIISKGTFRLTHEQWGHFQREHKIRRKGRVCRSFVTAGAIMYLSDCTHPLRGQRVQMVPFREGLRPDDRI